MKRFRVSCRCSLGTGAGAIETGRRCSRRKGETLAEREKVRIVPWHTQSTPSTRRRMAADHEARTIKPFCRKTPVITPRHPTSPTPGAFYRSLTTPSFLFSRVILLVACLPFTAHPLCPPFRPRPFRPVVQSLLISLPGFLSRSFTPRPRSLYRGLW